MNITKIEPGQGRSYNLVNRYCNYITPSVDREA